MLIWCSGFRVPPTLKIRGMVWSYLSDFAGLLVLSLPSTCLQLFTDLFNQPPVSNSVLETSRDLSTSLAGTSLININ